MVVFFEERDLVSFGNYLLSDNRTKMFDNMKEENKDDENYIDTRNSVNHADLENWAYLESYKKE